MMRTRGLALIIVVGVLGVLSVLAAAFVMMAQLERRASEQRVNAARAYLLARSGIEDALARLELGQDPAYEGEDWLGDGDQGPGSFDREQEVYQRGVLNLADCPVRHALRPSFFVRDGFATPRPALQQVDGRLRGYTGRLSERHAYALRIRSANAGIFVNGGDLGRDVSMEGPNGFLVRLLNNLEAVVTDRASPDLGAVVVGARPQGGYRSLDELPAGAQPFKPWLSLHAWVDPSVIKPQPMEDRPWRWQDIDEAHRFGTPVEEIAGVHEDARTVTYAYSTLDPAVSPAQVTGPVLTLRPGVSGEGTRASPWTQRITFTNRREGDPWTQHFTKTDYDRGATTYPVRWERDFVYAWSQLRAAPLRPEPRAPVCVNDAPREALAAVFLGLKGTHLEVWEGTAGWDGGFSWRGGVGTDYLYPSEATENSPWHRTRLDYGMTYGIPGRPWYGPSGYDPHAAPEGGGGKPVIQCAPLGRIRESLPITRIQALALSDQARRRIAEAGAFRAWIRFNAFVDALPAWEDLDDDGILDGLPYLVLGSGSEKAGGSLEGGIGTGWQGGVQEGVYTRRAYRREDADSDGLLRREAFQALTGDWKAGDIRWLDPALPRVVLEVAGPAPGLTRPQKDVLKAMANPNADLNDFNPDANLWKEVDKSDLLDHTTELSFEQAVGPVRIRALGRVLGQGRLLALRELSAAAVLSEPWRVTAQVGFRWGSSIQGPEAHYALSGGRFLLDFPEPAGLPPAAYDGQIGLGLIAPDPGPDETIRGALFAALEAEESGDPAEPDARGPAASPLLEGGNLFADGAYSEKDRSLKLPLPGNLPEVSIKNGKPDPPAARATFYAACWAKPNWFPEAEPRAHALISLSRASEPDAQADPPVGSYDVAYGAVPIDDIGMMPLGLTFAPARNNQSRDAMPLYVHATTSSTRGGDWPCHALLWGTTHDFFGSDNLNRRGTGSFAAKPMGRLEARRWVHLAVTGCAGGKKGSKLLLGRKIASANGGGWSEGFGHDVKALGAFHAGGKPNHLRFGEAAGAQNMNYAADATFANVRLGGRAWTSRNQNPEPENPLAGYLDFFTGTAGPAALGRYLKEDRATWASAPLPPGARALRITWTEIPCDLWFDEAGGDGWMDILRNDRDGNGRHDVRIDLEAWDDRGRLARFEDPAAENRIPRPRGRLSWKAVFVNEWDAATRLNNPLDVTPFLDDVTFSLFRLRVLAWDEGEG